MPPRRFAVLHVLSKGTIALSTRLNRVVCGLLVCAAAVMIAVVLLQVICRYLFNSSLFWSEELARMLLVQITFLGATAAFHGRMHIAVDIVAGAAGPKTRRILATACLLVCAALFAAMLVYGLAFSKTLCLQEAASLPVNRAVPFAVIPISGGVMLLHAAAMLFEEWVGPGKTPAQPEPRGHTPQNNPAAGGDPT